MVNPVNMTVSRATIVVTGDLLLVAIYGLAYVIAVTRSSGALVWLTQVDPSPYSIVTKSGTVYKGLVDFIFSC
ncbi:hypothetical protein SASPL_143900 [Salvia splendens]|uniref:Uncharacterized protein n=1 Tax=Salvia splendens TaxID=180675 RepID=A0A8X8WNH9_SALSN|nr:hypothetical protein SASPL_143900 [Salvia splendens]